MCEIFLNGWMGFTNTLEDAETPEPVHVSQVSDSERPANVVSKSRKHSIFTHFPKDRTCEVCLRTKITKSPCRRRIGEGVHRAEKFGNLSTADQQVLNEEMNRETIIDTLSWYNILPFSGFSLIRSKNLIETEKNS